MAQTTINIPDNKLQEVLDAVALEFNHAGGEFKTDTKSQFLRRQIARWLNDITRRQQYEAARRVVPEPASPGIT